ncbi:MAG: (Fe-S)-binding protein [Armatimonadetes bacterium CG_4_10_14_3_um_filter_66_18]|nr:MAG: (Fe-S)-binding protein [Armatimonadetes bacterium CG_4_10_14_3_um_filter_66_18]PJB60834.1 MAG: (Fe-S)-binding protein [Armatimonadetes bacterium CG_4_9_14_3_um_filter_66_14]
MMAVAEVAIEKKPDREPLYYVENPPAGPRVQAFLDAFAAILRHSNYRFVMDLYARTAAQCGRCATMCQVYQFSGDPEDIPCHRSKLLLDVYRRHFTWNGSLRARLWNDPGLTEEKLDELAESLWKCTACRRCSLECPLGLDHGLITHLGRWVLSEIGIIPKALKVSVREQLQGKTHNTSAVPVKAMLNSLEFLEEELEEATGVAVKFPVDVEGAEYVFFAPVSDYLMEADTLMGIAAVMHAAGTSWTIGTGNFDGINYGLFYSDWVLGEVLGQAAAEIRRLGGKKMLIGECGHASRTAKAFMPTFGGDNPPPVVNIIELTHQALRDGKLDFDPDAVTERITYHDPCNIARSGWIVEQPREILKSFCKNYVEMSDGGKANYCCGGGGGSVSIDEMNPYRMTVGGRRKAEQLRASGADIVIAPCANCKKQIREIIDAHEIPIEMMGLHDLVMRAIRLK